MSHTFTFKSLLLATALFAASIAAEKIDTDIQYETFNPSTVAIGSHLFTVSRYDYQIVVNSTDPTLKVCRAIVNTKPYFLGMRIKTAATPSKKIIIVQQQNYEHAPGSDIVFVDYQIFVVDPYTCSVRELRTPNGKAGNWRPVQAPDIVVREDNTFDIFYWSLRTCSPCRYDDQGNRVDLQQNLKPEPHVTTFDIHFRKLSKNHNYAYTFRRVKGFWLQIVDEDFNVLDSANISDVVDIAHNSIANVTYIGVIQKMQDIEFIYNFTMFEFKNKLRPVFSKFIRKSADWDLPVSANLIIDSEGNSYVTDWSKSSIVEGTTIDRTQYDARGKFIEMTKQILQLDSTGCDVQTFLLDNKKYCIAVHEVEITSATTKIKCFDLANPM